MDVKIVKLDKLSHIFKDKNSLSHDLVSYFRLFGIHSILHRVGMNKSKGSSPYDLIILLSLFRICGESIFTFYRLQNPPPKKMDWCRLLLSTAQSIFTLVR